MAIYGWSVVTAVIGTFALVFGLLAMIDSAAPGETGLTGTPPSAARASEARGRARAAIAVA